MAVSPPFSIMETVPADADFIRLFPAAERAFRDIVESWFGRISDATSGLPKMVFGTTAELAALSPQPPVGGFRYDTTTHNLSIKTDASTWVVMGTQPGTIGIFLQETAPLGWTKLTDAEYSGSILELVTDTTGGDFAGTTTIVSAALTQAMLPDVQFVLSGETTEDGAHVHFGETAEAGLHGHPTRLETNDSQVNDPSGGFMMSTDGDSNFAAFGGTTPTATAGEQIGANGTHTHNFISDSDGVHSHDLDGIAESGGSGAAVLAAVKRVKAIVCVKD